MFFRRKPSQPEAPSDLPGLITAALPDADEETRSIVHAVAGLLGCVAYADRDFSAHEEMVAENILSRIDGMTPSRAKDIVARLRLQIVNVSTIECPRYCRTLVQLCTRELRVEVLDALLEIAAADGQIGNDEVVVLRTLTRALGLDQTDYNRLQAPHRDLLVSLQQDPA